jgi:urease accessory protein
MAKGLGATVTVVEASFDPEAGAPHDHHHEHGHGG